MNQEKLNSPYLLSSVNNALKVLDLLSIKDSLGVSEISSLLQLNKSTVFKLLYTLEQRDYVLKTENAKYCLGYKFKNYGVIVSERQNLTDVALPFMHTLYSQVQETVCLSELNINGKTIVLALIDGNNNENVKSRIGYEMGSYNNANGRLLLANLSENYQQQSLERIHFTSKTPYSIPSKEALQKELDQIRGNRIVTVYDEYRLGQADIASPIFDGDGYVIAALSVVCSSEHLRKNQQEIAQTLLHTASLLSRKLGFYK